MTNKSLNPFQVKNKIYIFQLRVKIFATVLL